MTPLSVYPTDLKKSITANTSWGNWPTCYVCHVLLSDYEDVFTLFCMPLEISPIECKSTIRLKDSAHVHPLTH